MINNNIFFITICLLVSKKINEYNFVFLIRIYIDNNIFNLLNIIDIEEIFICLHNLKFDYVYNYLLSLYLISDIEKNFYLILDNYKQLNDEYIENNRNISFINEFFKSKLLIINSFLKVDSIIGSNNNKINNLYLSNLREDIINRLFYFRNHFDIDIIKFIGIELIEYKIIINYKISELLSHYKLLINTFNKKFKKWITLFEIYEKTLNNYNNKLKIIKNMNFKLNYDLINNNLYIK